MQRPVGVALLLGIGAFVVGTCELVLAGLLPELGQSFSVSVATVGQVVTAFGVTAAAAGPVLAAVTLRWQRRRVLLLSLAFYMLGTALSGLSWSFGMLLFAQVLAACGAGLFLPTATVIGADLAGPERRGRAVATVTAGMTVAIAVGAPLGTAFAALSGWRATMVVLSVLAVLVAAAVLARVPQARAGDHDDRLGLRQRLAPLFDHRVVALLGTTLVAFTAIYIPYTYISVVVADATGGDGRWLAVVLATLGTAGIAGNVLAGRLADRYGGRPVIAGALLGLTVVFGSTPLWSATFPTAVLAAAAYGLIGFGVSAPQTYRMLALGGQASLSVALNGAALYLAIALSGVIGGLALTAFGPDSLALVAATGAIVALGLSEIAHKTATRQPQATRA